MAPGGSSKVISQRVPRHRATEVIEDLLPESGPEAPPAPHSPIPASFDAVPPRAVPQAEESEAPEASSHDGSSDDAVEVEPVGGADQ